MRPGDTGVPGPGNDGGPGFLGRMWKVDLTGFGGGFGAWDSEHFCLKHLNVWYCP